VPTDFTGHDAAVARVVSMARRGWHVQLAGPPGSGRSHALRRARDELDDDGWTVVDVRGVPELRRRPLEALALAGLAPRGGQHASPVAAAVEAVERRAEGPCVVAVDDADALDEASAAALRLAADHGAVRLLFTTATPFPGDADVLAVTPVGLVELPPLPYDDVLLLVQEVAGRRVEPVVVGQIAARAGGSPALVSALAQAWSSGEDDWSVLEPAARHQLVGLDADAIDALQALARVEPVDTDYARGLIGARVLRALDRRGLLRPVSAGSSTLVVVFPPLVGELLRRRAGEVTTGAAADTSTTVPEPWSTSRREALARRYAVAFGRALEVEQQTRLVAARREWLERRGAASGAAYLRAALARGGDADAARAVADALGEPVDGAQVALRTALATAALASRDGDAAVALLDASARSASGACAELLTVAALRARLLTTRNPGAEALDPFRSSSNAEVRAVAALVAAECDVSAGRARAALATLATIGDEHGEVAGSRDVMRGLALLASQGPAAALDWAWPAYERARASFDTDRIHGHGYVAALALGAAGRLTDLRDHLGALLVGDLPACDWPFVAATLSIAGYMSMAERRTVRAAVLAAQAIASALPGPLPGTSVAWSALVRPEGDGAAARLWVEVERHLDAGWVLSGATTALAAVLAQPDEERTRWLADRLQSSGAGDVGHVVTFASARSSDDPRAAVAAGDALVGAGHALLAAEAYRHAAHLLRSAGRTADVLGVLRVAREALRSAGGQLDALLDSAGPVATLTVRERQLVEMAAAGHANAEIAARLHLSVRTVENHLRSAYGKLGVADRHEAARVLGG
jgi:DNA-binding CsgD family transcriptional regulator